MDWIKEIVNRIISIFTSKKKLEVKQNSSSIIPPQESDTIQISRTEAVDDEMSNIVMVEDESINFKSSMKILIDNGHGENTPGKRSPYSACGTTPAVPFFEYSWNREIAKEVVSRLQSQGYDAELLVPEIEDISLTERVKRVNNICKKLGKTNVIFISIHSNAAGNGKDWYTARGWSAYTSVGKTKSDDLADCLYDVAEKVFTSQRIRTDKKDGDRDWEENFYVLKNTNCAAVLTENFFYDNVDDVKYILSDQGKEAVIKCHVEGIIKYVKSL